MSNNLTQDQMRIKVETFMRGLYLDVQGPVGAPGAEGSRLTEEYLIRVVTRFAVSLASAWWSITELFEYFRNRRLVRDLNGTLS